MPRVRFSSISIFRFSRAVLEKPYEVRTRRTTIEACIRYIADFCRAPCITYKLLCRMAVRGRRIIHCIDFRMASISFFFFFNVFFCKRCILQKLFCNYNKWNNHMILKMGSIVFLNKALVQKDIYYYWQTCALYIIVVCGYL